MHEQFQRHHKRQWWRGIPATSNQDDDHGRTKNEMKADDDEYLSKTKARGASSTEAAACR